MGVFPCEIARNYRETLSMRIFCWGIHCVGGSQLYMQQIELFMFKTAKLGEKKSKTKHFWQSLVILLLLLVVMLMCMGYETV